MLTLPSLKQTLSVLLLPSNVKKWQHDGVNKELIPGYMYVSKAGCSWNFFLASVIFHA